jgi:hypothetical protein
MNDTFKVCQLVYESQHLSFKNYTILKTLTAKGAKVSSIESRPSYGDASIANLAEFLTALPP